MTSDVWTQNNFLTSTINSQKVLVDDLINMCRRYMAGILPIRRKTQNNQSIKYVGQSFNLFTLREWL